MKDLLIKLYPFRYWLAIPAFTIGWFIAKFTNASASKEDVKLALLFVGISLVGMIVRDIASK